MKTLTTLAGLALMVLLVICQIILLCRWDCGSDDGLFVVVLAALVWIVGRLLPKEAQQ